MNKINCILLVDDDNTTNFVNQMLLEGMGVTQQVLTANNGWEALQLIKQQCSEDDCPQLILLDLSMPEKDGFEFLEAYEELEFDQKQSVEIVVLTTSMNPGDIERLKKNPSKELLINPLLKKRCRLSYGKNIMRMNSWQFFLKKPFLRFSSLAKFRLPS